MMPATAGLDPYALQQAEIRASHLVAAFGFTRTDWDDLRQDMLLDYLKRRPRFHAGRGEHRGFIFGVIRNRSTRLAVQSRRHPAFVSGVDDKVLLSSSCGRPSLSSTARSLDLQIDVRKVLDSLPEHLREVALMLSQMSVGEVRRETGKSRQRIYQLMGEIRQAFVEAGLAPEGGNR